MVKVSDESLSEQSSHELATAHLYRIEEMDSDKFLGSAAELCHFANGQTRRVGSKDSLGLADCSQLGVELFLEIHVFNDWTN